MTGTQNMRITPTPGWLDHSMLVLSAAEPGASGVNPNLIVTREPLPGAGTTPDAVAARLDAYVDTQVAGWRQRAGYEEVMRSRPTPASLVAEVRIAWNEGGQALAQWLTYALVDPETIVIAAATAGRADMAELEPRFRDLLETLQLD